MALTDEVLFDLFHAEMIATLADADTSTENDELLLRKLESLGCTTGIKLIEAFSRDYPKFSDELGVMKFICKDLWQSLYRKPVDNLKTNQQGTYFMWDNKFRPLLPLSMHADFQKSADKFLAFPCGLLRGALIGLGLPCTIVTAEVSSPPACKFQICLTNFSN